MRTILVHLNVELPDHSQRTADEVAAWIEEGLDRGLELGMWTGRVVTGEHLVTVAMAEEV